MNQELNNIDRPNLDRKYFWEFVYDKIDWRVSYRTVIQRILERGEKQDWEELIRFYSEDKVVSTIKDEIAYMPDDIIQETCDFFHLKKEQLRCYIRKQSLPRHWI